MRERAHARAVLALVEEEAGLLARADVGDEAETVLEEGDAARLAQPPSASRPLAERARPFGLSTPRFADEQLPRREHLPRRGLERRRPRPPCPRSAARAPPSRRTRRGGRPGRGRPRSSRRGSRSSRAAGPPRAAGARPCEALAKERRRPGPGRRTSRAAPRSGSPASRRRARGRGPPRPRPRRDRPSRRRRRGATAPEKSQGCRRRTDASRPGFQIGGGSKSRSLGDGYHETSPLSSVGPRSGPLRIRVRKYTLNARRALLRRRDSRHTDLLLRCPPATGGFFFGAAGRPHARERGEDPVAERADRRRHRDRQDPGVDDPARHAPAHRRERAASRRRR